MKRFISISLCLLMLLSIFTIFTFASDDELLYSGQSIVKDNTYSVGDLNDDNAINAKDANMLKSSIVGNSIPSMNKSAADILADGKLNAKDVLLLKSIIVGTKNANDFETSKAIYSFNIAGNPIDNYSIVIPTGTEYSNNMYFSAQIMQLYIYNATGIKLNIVYDTKVKDHAIYYIDAPYNTELGSEISDDGYKYEVKDGDLYIYGGLRGKMYATYDILEYYLGYLFYDNYKTYIASDRYVNMEEGLNKQFTPAYHFRYVYTYFWGSTKEWWFYPRHLNGSPNATNSGDSRYGYFYGSKYLNAHSYWYYWSMGKGTMPEEGTLKSDGTPMTLAERYYQKFLDGGGNSATDATSSQPCATSEEVFNTLYSGLLDTINFLVARGYDIYTEGYPEGIFSFSMNDNLTYHSCRNCKAIAVKGEEGYPALYVQMASKAADKIQEVYPGAKLMTIIYEPTLPKTIKPSSNLILFYCGSINACAVHHFEEDCNISSIITSSDSKYFHGDEQDEKAIDVWVNLANEVGTEVWYWYYPENYSFYLYDLPVVFDMYYDYQYLANHGVKGIYYEGCGQSFYNFETLKGFLASELSWNPYMSLDEYKELIQKYLHAKYGEGGKHVYNYLIELENAADLINICVPYYSGAFDSFDKEYIAEHYEYMRSELYLALEEQKYIGDRTAIYQLIVNCEVLGLSACYDSMYTNGTAESRSTYEERYTWLYNYLKNNNYVYTYGDNQLYFKLPDSISFSASPLMQIYKMEHRYNSLYA